MRIKYMLFAVVLISATQLCNAQIFGKILDATEEKVGNEAAEEISDEAAEGTESILDGIFGKKKKKKTEEPATRESDDLLQGDEDQNDRPDNSLFEDDENVQGTDGYDMGALNDFMANMDQSANLPAAYRFDFIMDIVVTSTGEDPANMQMLFSTANPGLFAMKTYHKGEESIFLYDEANNLNVIYQIDKKGRRKGQALPNMMDLAAQYGMQNQQVNSQLENYNIQKVGPGKMVAGYPTTKYVGGNDEAKGEMFVSTKLPVNWKESFGGLFLRAAPSVSGTDFEDMEGMMLESNSTDIKTGETTSWVTTKAEKRSEVIVNAEWDFSNN